MEMAIDEAIRRIDEHNYIHQSKEPRAIKISEALNVAMDTMRRYEKIKQILKEIPYGGEATVRRIQEVVEDGNND
jgi:hypothetical protein